jgi:Flp pilus assembly protein CpaB
MDVPVARRVERPAWVNARTVLGLLLFALAFLAGQRILAAGETEVALWAAARDLAQGTVISERDLQLVEADLPGELIRRYVAGSQVVEGAVLVRPVRAGELLPVAWVSSGESSSGLGRAMVIPLTPESSVIPSLRPGDRVDIFATFDAGDVRARTTLVVRGIDVVEVETTGGLVMGEEAVTGIEVSVSPEDAARLAFAIRNGQIDIVRIDDAQESASDTTIEAGDF